MRGVDDQTTQKASLIITPTSNTVNVLPTSGDV